MKKALLSATLAASVLLCCGALAQTNPPTASPREDCRAELPPNGDAAGKQPEPRTDSLTDTLADCNGVLTPPATGDGEMAEPAPAQGETPVIKPEALPDQPPSTN